MPLSVSTKSNLNLLALSHAWKHDQSFESYKRRGHFSLYILEAMSRNSLPGFAYQGRKHPLQKPKEWYGDFAGDLKAYYQLHTSDIRRGLRFGTIPEEKHFSVQLHSLIKTFGKKYQLPVKHVILCPNVFGVPGEGYGPRIGNSAFAIFTPNPKKDQTWLMVHEVCHALLLPVFKSTHVKRLISETKPLLGEWTTEKFRTYYPKWEWAIEEYMIHAIEQRVTHSSLKEKESWGMDHLDWFVKSWAEFQARCKKNGNLTVEDWVVEALQQMKVIIRAVHTKF